MRPYRIAGRTTYRAYATFTIVIVNILFILWEILLTMHHQQPIGAVIGDYALSACSVGHITVGEFAVDGFRSIFMHASFIQFATNMLFLWVFAPSVEQFLGVKRFMVFFILAGFGGHVFSMLFNPTDCEPLLGPSASIAGVMAAFLVLYPTKYIETFFPLLGRAFNLPALVVILLYMGIQFFVDSGGPLSGDYQPFWDEIGGFIVGLIVIFAAVMFKPAPPVDPFDYLD